MQYLGDYTEDYATLNFKFHSRSLAQVPTTLSGSPAISVYKANNATQTTTGITLTTDFDSVTGLNNVLIDLSADAFYAIGNDYQVVITAGTVDSVSVVGTVVAHFSIENRFNEVIVSDKTGFSLAVTPPTAPEIADAVCDEALAAHSTPGTVGISITDTLGYVTALRSALTDLRAAALDRIVGTIATGTHEPQSGDSYAIVNDGTYGLSAIETLVDDIETRLTATRAGYLDNLSAGAVALATGVTVTTNNDKTGYSLSGTDISDIKTVTAKIDTALELDGAVYRFTENALEEAPGGSGGDATAANQLIIIDHLTDVKGAAFSEATDSLEAIRNRGDVAWITGGGLSGSNEITITVQDDSAVNILEASVEIWDEAGTAFYEKKFSNSSGQAVFNLDNGTYTIKIHKAGYSYPNTALTVSAAAAVTCEMTAYVVPSPASADLCRIYTYIIKGDGSKYSAITSTATVPLYDMDNNLVSGQISGVYNATTGLLYFDLIRGIKAGISISNISYNKTVNVPNLETAKLDEI